MTNQTIAVPDAPAPTPVHESRLRGWPLALARATLIAVMAFTVAAGLVALPDLYAMLSRVCSDVLNTCLVGPAQVAPLARLDLTPHGLLVPRSRRSAPRCARKPTSARCASAC
jgi:hypothetical protein